MMSESNGHAVPVCIDQSDDFVEFEIDGLRVQADLYAAHNAMAKIDVKHRDDLWECFECQSTFVRTPNDLTDKCPGCGKGNTRRDECWLDDVAAYVRSLGSARCGRRAAALFYNSIVERMESLKKKSNPTPGSLFGSEESMPASGEAAARQPGSAN